MSDNRPSKKQSAKDAAQAARKAAEAEQKKRERLITIIGVVVVVVIVAAVVGVVVLANKSTQTNVALPTGVDSKTYGYSVNTTPSSAPLVQTFEDFQCSACGAFQKAGMGKALDAGAAAGKIRLMMQPMIFIEQNPSVNNDSSTRATNAWGCAIDQGVGVAYHETVFAHQPAEGVGYTNAQLISYGKEAGLSGSKFDTFAKCVPTTKYYAWAKAAEKYAESQGVVQTPTVHVNGKEFTITNAEFQDPSKLVPAILAFAAKK